MLVSIEICIFQSHKLSSVTRGAHFSDLKILRTKVLIKIWMPKEHSYAWTKQRAVSL